ncbi:MAG TPA: hypothetical protein VH280_12450 [Verrucomicrobiae bacterium]|jgi:membrane protein DedA with SNARE-associated domain|nr:hypothetical protein [Verrucomicrobiae bacterium]
MDHFWTNIYDDAKDRRYGTLFVAALFVGTPLIILAVFLTCETFAVFMEFLSGLPELSPFQAVCLALLAGLALTAMGLFWWRWIRIGRKVRQNRLQLSRLSRDELMKARSKLKSRMNPVKFRVVERPAKRAKQFRAPDTDLKY